MASNKFTSGSFFIVEHLTNTYIYFWVIIYILTANINYLGDTIFNYKSTKFIAVEHVCYKFVSVQITITKRRSQIFPETKNTRLF